MIDLFSFTFDLIKTKYESMFKKKTELNFVSINALDIEKYSFKSGKKYIDEFLICEAKYLHIVNEVSTHLVIYKNDVIGFYSLSVNTTNFDCEIRGNRTFNCIQLDYIAVDQSYHKQGIGQVILNNIKYMCSDIADRIGCRGIITAPDNDVIEWYKKNDFEYIECDNDGNQLYFFDFRDHTLYTEANKKFYN